MCSLGKGTALHLHDAIGATNDTQMKCGLPVGCAELSVIVAVLSCVDLRVVSPCHETMLLRATSDTGREERLLCKQEDGWGNESFYYAITACNLLCPEARMVADGTRTACLSPCCVVLSDGCHATMRMPVTHDDISSK